MVVAVAATGHDALAGERLAIFRERVKSWVDDFGAILVYCAVVQGLICVLGNLVRVVVGDLKGLD